MMPVSTVLDHQQLGVLVRAVSRAPSVHNSQPWELAVRGEEIDLVRRRDVVLRVHDPEGADSDVSCGAACANLVLAARSLGRAAEVELFGAGLVAATVRVGAPEPATTDELALYHAIGRRRSYRRAFLNAPVPEAAFAAVLAAGDAMGVRGVRARRFDALARLLGFATRAFKEDKAYQRELALWTTQMCGDYALGAGDGIPEDALSGAALPIASLVRARTPVPDDAVLAERLAAENLLFLCTGGDSGADHLAAGIALQRSWLTATAHGLAGSVLTQPLRLTGFQRRLSDELGLPGVPQAIFRFGLPAGTAPPSPRLPLGDIYPADFPGEPR
ncbi:Acg family FMN-binding oxidoreductase [Amycolatopsis sp. CA-230715]|uniref:Acg family FMN-binding oxidoreductase n=1 Tax=Amycolatopsis sp. CA-230715 TaxID=2745196 RepID=UPI001C01783D|nr:nitroreductase family protein [Amycolatopsis sp. CA-230715]QWF78010.1 Putative NAD(P)H nitroreductase [Amycolatopsis sp. CA-230715]